jgi:phosphatidylinositol-3-phosphatase
MHGEHSRMTADNFRRGSAAFLDRDARCPSTTLSLLWVFFLLAACGGGPMTPSAMNGDTTPPTIAITSPTSGSSYATGSASLSISGTAADNVGVTQVTWSNSRGGSGTASGTTSWSIGGVTLQSGNNVLTVAARDAANNTASKTLTVTYTPPDTTPPTITSTSPAASAINVATTSAISVTFSEAMDSATITSLTFFASGVSGSIQFSGTTATFRPSSALSASTTYTVTVTTGVKDVAGNPLGSNRVWSFMTAAQQTTHIQTVFIILMENNNWSDIRGNPSAPYINNTLLPIASHAEQYFNPPSNHPSLPNYLWLEAGTNFGILDDNDPSVNSQSSTQHLVTLLQANGIAWSTYQEDITGSDCPLTDLGLYAVRHNPFVYFNDVTNNQSPNSPSCISHVRPLGELATDLLANTVARYNFITPDLCHDMHDSCGPVNDAIAQGDTWLSQQLPPILASSAYKNGGAVFIVWDEAGSGDGPIGMIVLSPFAKGAGYQNTIHYSHGSTLRTMEEIFGVTPLLGHAATDTDLSDLFAVFP